MSWPRYSFFRGRSLEFSSGHTEGRKPANTPQTAAEKSTLHQLYPRKSRRGRPAAVEMSVSAVAARGLLSAASASAHEGGARTWKILSFVVALPGVAVCMTNAYVKSQHEEHGGEFTAYSHLRIRTKKFPWGDGNHSLFHNPHTNPLPDGFEGHDH